MRVEGGSVRFQIGASEPDIVLLVMNAGGMRHLLFDKFTIGGEATAAGPIGRDLSDRFMVLPTRHHHNVPYLPLPPITGAEAFKGGSLLLVARRKE